MGEVEVSVSAGESSADSRSGLVLFHGCRSTHIFCLPTCRYDRRVLDRNRVYFESIQEALAADYRACKVCRPANRTAL